MGTVGEQSFDRFIDIHVHACAHDVPLRGDVPAFSTPEQLLALYEDIRVERAVILPIVNPETAYIPQGCMEVLDICRRQPERFIPFCNIDPRSMTNSADAPLDVLLRFYRDHGFKGVGEVAANLYFLDPLVQNLFHHVEAAGLPLTFHIAGRIGDTYGLFDNPGLPQLEACLRRFPKLRFLGHSQAFWSEIAQLGPDDDRCDYPPGPIAAEGAVPRLMRSYPNLYGDLSAGSGYNALARDADYAVRFLNEFQDRLLYGTDICAPQPPKPLAAFLLGLRAEGRISEEVFMKVARENAIALLALDEN